MNTLILGGARSGKSAYSETLARDSGLQVIYLATASASDAEMARRIAHHQTRRPAHWQTVECDLALADPLRQHATANTCLLVDCLTMWLTNLLFAGRGAAQAEAGEALDCALLRGEIDRLLATLPTLPGEVILVSNEVGWSIVPANPLARVFTDEQGRLNQRVAKVCDDVVLVAAGLPLQLKRTPKEQVFGL